MPCYVALRGLRGSPLPLCDQMQQHTSIHWSDANDTYFRGSHTLYAGRGQLKQILTLVIVNWQYIPRHPLLPIATSLPFL